MRTTCRPHPISRSAGSPGVAFLAKKLFARVTIRYLASGMIGRLPMPMLPGAIRSPTALVGSLLLENRGILVDRLGVVEEVKPGRGVGHMLVGEQLGGGVHEPDQQRAAPPSSTYRTW